MADIFQDLAAEYERLDGIFAGLSAAQWSAPSAATGWSVADVVTHLALTEAAVVQTLRQPADGWTTRDHLLDSEMDQQVRDAQWDGSQAFEQWRSASTASVAALQNANPQVAVRWAAAPLRPRTLATTRLAEHWAHTLDIVGPLDFEFPDTDRLQHLVWLGHATLPYTFGLHDLPPRPIRVQVTSPSGDMWTYGPLDCASIITGSASAFCRVGAQRLAPDQSGLLATDEHAATALRVLRNYAA